MSTFYDNWKQCMQGNGLPVPTVDDAVEALEFLEKLHSAWEAAGGDDEMLMGALVVGGVAGVDEVTLGVLGDAASITFTVYFAAGMACLASQALDYLRARYASNDLSPYAVTALNSQGIDLSADTAVA